ncbi:hypothetical protein BJX70DRAFT_405870 [Aspergillus crustosus]
MATTTVNPQHLAATRKKYAEEANKRLRPEGTAQFLPLTSSDSERLRSLADDPWVNHAKLNAQSPPIKENSRHRFFILGAGFGGLQFAVRLLNEGIAKSVDEIRLADAAGGFGGTWCWNRFPGLHCDIESYVYLPLLEETGYVPSHKYAPAAEIRGHAERIAEKWNLGEKTSFRTDIESVAWDEREQVWIVDAVEHRGHGERERRFQFKAEYVYLAAGVLTKPQVPKIPGIPKFGGKLFHTARWNYGISGGSQEDQRLTGLQGKRVAVIGTAATAIAVVPEVAKYAKELFVVQRTPAYVKARNQRPTDPKEFQSTVAGKKGWQDERQRNLNKFMTRAAKEGEVNLVNDGWTDSPAYSAVLGTPGHGVVGELSQEELEKHWDNYHALDLPHQDRVRARVDEIVKDHETAEKLKPWYPSWCKRPTFSDFYLQAFNRPNVHLVDTDGKGPSDITEKGVVVAGKEYPVDIIIFSTGYKTPSAGNGSPSARTGVHIIGRGGQSLDEKWASVGPATLHGYATSGFPNLFFSGTAQATITGNNIFMLGLIAKHVAYWIGEAEKRVGSGREKRAIVEVTRDAEEAHAQLVLQRSPFYSVIGGCTPGYFNGYGEGAAVTDPVEKAKRAKASTWSEGTISFLNLIEDWRAEGNLKGLSVVPARELRAQL